MTLQNDMIDSDGNEHEKQNNSKYRKLKLTWPQHGVMKVVATNAFVVRLLDDLVEYDVQNLILKEASMDTKTK